MPTADTPVAIAPPAMNGAARLVLPALIIAARITVANGKSMVIISPVLDSLFALFSTDIRQEL